MPTAPTGQTDSPVASYDEGKVRELVERCLAEIRSDSTRNERDRQDWKNLLYYRGGADNQWITWDGQRYITKPTTGQGAIPDWVPRAATNLFAKKIDGISALLDQSQPAQEWGPATDDDEDRATAEVIEDALPVLREESSYDDLRPIINKSACLMDKVAVVVFFDQDPKHGTEKIQAWRCLNQDCGTLSMPKDISDGGDVCPECGSAELEPAVNERFEPIGAEYPKGRITTELVSSYELSLPPGSRHTNTARLPYVMTHTRYSKDDAAKLGYDVGTGANSGGLETGRQYADAMPGLSSPSSASNGQGPAKADRDSVLVYRLWHDPTDEFPEGLYAVYAAGKVYEKGPLPLKDFEGRPVKNIAIRTFMPVPGTAYGKPPADDLTQLQTQLNLSETLAFMILMHHAAPQTWLSDTITVLDEIQNVPGAINRYKSNQPGDKPVTVPGTGFPEALKWWLERLDQKFEEVSGMNAVLAGQRPAGDPTLGEVELLREQGLGSFRTPLDELIAFEIQVSRLLILTARQSAWAPRFRRIRGENGEWEITQFTSADLMGNADVHVEPASAWPTSLLVQQMRIDKAVQMGIIQPGGDPELQLKLLSKMNLAELKPSLDIDRKQIAREIDRWKQAQDPAAIVPPNLAAINVPMHLFYKQQFLKTEVAEAMQSQNPPVYQAMMAHVQALQMAAAPPPPPDPSQPPDGKGTPPEKGTSGGALDQALESGVLRPAGSGGQGLDEMMKAGVLVPAGSQQQPQGPTGPSMDELLEQGVLTPAQPPVQEAPEGLPMQ